MHRHVAEDEPFNIESLLEGEALRLFRLRAHVAPDTVTAWTRDYMRRRLADIALESPFRQPARILAVHAFRAIGIPPRRTAWLLGVSPATVRRHAHRDITTSLADAAIVNVAEGELELATCDGATRAEADAARDWLRRQTLAL